MLADEAMIVVAGGQGGSGKVSFYPMRKGPDGGDGGRGGDVYVRANRQITSLNAYTRKREFKAPAGNPGDSNRKQGANGTHLVLDVPMSTTITNVTTGWTHELNNDGESVLICRGGEGGRGNDAFKSATNQAPKKAEPGKPGQTAHLKLVLKLIADYGLVGLPNAGKSSLLNALTAASVKTANYPFTTLEPNLGALGTKIIADIPGLIEGASSGKGLGIRFLKHIEKVTLLLHCIPADSEDVLRDFETVQKELANYNPELAAKKSIILLTKVDLIHKEQIHEKIALLKQKNPQVLSVSVYDEGSLDRLKQVLI